MKKLTEDWLALSDSSDCLEYWKESLPCGDFKTWPNGAHGKPVPFKIRKNYLEHLELSFRAFQKNGVAVPIYSTHVQRPENRRGSVTDIKIEKNAKGVDSCFLKLKFKSTEARDEGIANDVSVHLPAKHVDGTGHMYKWPLQHVAITPTPVIPGLEDFETPTETAYSISASFPESYMNGSNEMKDTLESLTETLGLTEEDTKGMDEQQKQEFALGVVETLKENASGSPEPAGEKPGEKEEKEEKEEKPEEKEITLSQVSPHVLDQLVQLRSGKIDALTLSRVLSPAHADELRAKYCTPEESVLSLSMGEDEFDRTIQTLERVGKEAIAEKVEFVSLSHKDGGPVEQSLSEMAAKM